MLAMAMALNFTHELGDSDLAELSRRNPGYQLERDARGRLVVTPTGGESSRRAAEVLRQLAEWARVSNAGPTFDSSTGFKLADGSVLSPDAAWIRSERWTALTPEEREAFPPLCPDAVFEVRSRSDCADYLRAKMRLYIANGAATGILIDPYDRFVEIYRPNRDVELMPYDSVRLGSEVPEFSLDLRALA